MTGTNSGRVVTLSDLVADRIVAARQRQGWTAKDLERACAAIGATQLTSAVIANIETGRRDSGGRRRRDVTVDELLAVSLALGISPTELFESMPDDSETQVAVTSAIDVPPNYLVPWLQGENSTMSVALLDGFALCKSCRTPVRSRMDGKRVDYFCPNKSCPSPVKKCAVRKIDTQVKEMCSGILEQEENFYSGFASAQGKSKELLESRLSQKMSELTDLRVRRAAAVDDINSLADHIGMDIKTLAGALKSFDARMQDCVQEIARLTAELQQIRHDGDLRQQWDTLPATRLRELIATLGTVIITPECGAEMEWAWIGQDGAPTPTEPQ